MEINGEIVKEGLKLEEQGQQSAKLGQKHYFNFHLNIYNNIQGGI